MVVGASVGSSGPPAGQPPGLAAGKRPVVEFVADLVLGLTASREDADGDRQNTAEDHAMADSTHSEGPQQGGGGDDSEKGTDEELSFAFADFAEDIAAELDPLAGGLVPSNDPPPLVNSEGMAEAFGQFRSGAPEDGLRAAGERLPAVVEGSAAGVTAEDIPALDIPLLHSAAGGDPELVEPALFPREAVDESHVGSDHFGGFVVAASEGELDSVFVSGGEQELPSGGLVDHPLDGDSYTGNSQGYQDAPALVLQTLGETAAAAAGGARPADIQVVKPVSTLPARRRGIGAVGSAVLGGLCALPLTYAILIWGFQRDPLQLAPLVPGAAAFLLPTSLRPGTELAVSSPAPAAALESLPGAPQLPVDLESPAVAQADPPEQTSALEIQNVAVDETPVRASEAAGVKNEVGLAGVEEGPLRTGSGPDLPLVLAASGAGEGEETGANSSATLAPAASAGDHVPRGLPEKSLDPAVGMALAAVEMAEEKASVALQALVEAPAQAGEKRNRLRVRWYRALAEMAGSLTAYERTAVEAGQPGVEMPDVRSLLQNTTGSDESVQQDLEELGCMWLTSVRRTSDGAVLAGTLEEVRPSGPYWRSRVRSTSPLGTPAWSFISRDRPAANPGERVVVIGVILDDDMIWAASYQTLQAGSDTPGGR